MSNTHKMGESLKVSAKLQHARSTRKMCTSTIIRACLVLITPESEVYGVTLVVTR